MLPNLLAMIADLDFTNHDRALALIAGGLVSLGLAGGVPLGAVALWWLRG